MISGGENVSAGGEADGTGNRDNERRDCGGDWEGVVAKTMMCGGKDYKQLGMVREWVGLASKKL